MPNITWRKVVIAVIVVVVLIVFGIIACKMIGDQISSGLRFP
jgi:hypothetical protein